MAAPSWRWRRLPVKPPGGGSPLVRGTCSPRDYAAASRNWPAAPLFLIGVLSLVAGGLTLTQYFARGYEEEAALLNDFSRFLPTSRMVVTFNGETFDLPYLRDRSIYHRLPAPLFPDHLDLLP